MSGETEKNESGWTTDTLKEYVSQRFDDNQKAVDAALISQEKAVAAALAATKEAIGKAEAAAEKRFESVNEFRQQLNDQANTLMPRQEYTVQHKALEDKITDISDRMNTNEGQTKGVKESRIGLYAAIAAVGGVLGIIIVVMNIIT